MTFVNERISDADKARIDFSKIMHPVDNRLISSQDWTVDHERDIALIYLGGGVMERPYYFLLYWQGQVLTIFLKATYTGNFKVNDLEVTWSIDQWDLPNNVLKEEMLLVLKEALFSFGFKDPEYRHSIKSIFFTF